MAVDGSETSFKAFSYALTLAKMAGSTVTGLHVIFLPFYGSQETIRVLQNELSAKAKGIMESVREMAEESKVSFQERIITTDRSVVLAIVEEAAREEVDLLVVGTAGTTAVPKLMLGSVAAGVVNRADCPVLVVR